METINPWIEVIICVLIAGGYFALGLAWNLRKITFWKTEWISLEHDLARCEGREPREIRDFEADEKAHYQLKSS